MIKDSKETKHNKDQGFKKTHNQDQGVPGERPHRLQIWVRSTHNRRKDCLPHQHARLRGTHFFHFLKF